MSHLPHSLAELPITVSKGSPGGGISWIQPHLSLKPSSYIYLIPSQSCAQFNFSIKAFCRFSKMSFLFQLFAIFTVVLCTSLESQIAGSAGCGKKHWFNGITQYNFDLKSSGRNRSYSIHLPPDYNETSPYPVVLGFHGSQSVGLFFEVDTKMSESQYSSGVSFSFSSHLWCYSIAYLVR